jgi:hypothetical protein
MAQVDQHLNVSTNAMKTLTSITLLLTFWVSSYGQDGSNIRYFKVGDVDKSLIGQYVHFDFFNRSFHGRPIDTVTIAIDGKEIRFKEVRKDNGFNNWFFEQNLQSIERVDELIIKIAKLRLDSLTAHSFQVTMYIDFFDVNFKLLADKSRQIVYWFDKKNIVEVLVETK